MRKVFASLFGVLVLAGAVAGQVKGPPEVNVPVGRLASVPLQIDADESDYVILGTDVDAFREYDPDPKKLRLRLIGYAPGTSFVVVATQRAGKLQPLFQVRVVVTGANPVPPVPPVPPGPTPDPTPPPGPTSPAKFVVVIVEETADAVSTRGAFFSDPKLAARMKEKGHRMRVVDKDVVGPNGSPPADVKRFLDDAKSKGTPRIYLVDEKGHTAVSGPVPNTPADLIALLSKYGG